MQDDGIHANLRYTQQAYAATVMKVTHATFVQFPHSYLPGMTGPPNSFAARGPVTLTTILFPQPAV